MSTSLLYHAWGLRGYRQQAIDFGQEIIVFRIQQDPQTLCCGHCGSADVSRPGTVVRRFGGLPIGKEPVWLQLPVQRLWCATRSVNFLSVAPDHWQEVADARAVR